MLENKQYTATIQKNFDAQMDHMGKILAEGDGYFLIGGRVTPKGIMPVSFMFNLPEESSQKVTKLTPDVVAMILDRLLDKYPDPLEAIVSHAKKCGACSWLPEYSLCGDCAFAGEACETQVAGVGNPEAKSGYCREHCPFYHWCNRLQGAQDGA
jgi:hypothetical protein